MAHANTIKRTEMKQADDNSEMYMELKFITRFSLNGAEKEELFENGFLPLIKNYSVILDGNQNLILEDTFRIDLIDYLKHGSNIFEKNKWGHVAAIDDILLILSSFDKLKTLRSGPKEEKFQEKSSKDLN